MGKPGRPSKYQDDFARQAEHLGKLGATDEQAAAFFGVEVRTLYRWKEDHPEFCQALKDAKAEPDQQVEVSLYRRALGYSHPAVKIHVSSDGTVTEVPYTEHYAPDTTAAIFWLKNRQPSRWRDVKAQEISGPDGEKLTIQIVRHGEASAAGSSNG